MPIPGTEKSCREAIVITTRATSRHMADLGSPRTFGKNIIEKKCFEATKITASLEVLDQVLTSYQASQIPFEAVHEETIVAKQRRAHEPSRRQREEG